jgi:SAM-dependent methyltransferase
MRSVMACPGCRGVDREPVCEFNGLVLLEYMRSSPLARYDYAMCRTCGLVYATRRPEGEELTYLYERFDEVLGRAPEQQTAGRAGEVSEAERQSIHARLASGWLVSEEDGPSDEAWMAEVFEERVLNSFHVNVVGSLVPVAGKRVLELRTTTGFMLDVLRRRYGAAEVYAMPMSERHGVIIDALNPMPMALIDFDRLDIPFAGTFDLILARHMVTHAAEPSRLWEVLASRLNPGGYVYFFLENDDRAMLQDKRKNLLGEMKCFHFQNFDLPAFARVLRHNALDPLFIRHPRPGRSEMICVARRNEQVRPRTISPADFDARLALYRRWRDHSVLSLGDEMQALFLPELDGMRQRAMADGYAVTDKAGRIVPRKPLRLMHEAGYARLNERRVSEVG